MQSIELSSTAPTTEIECSGSTSVSYITGLPRHTMTVTGALDEDDTVLIAAIQVNDAGAIACDPAGIVAGTIDISSTNATVSDVSYSMPINGFSSYNVTFVLDDLTIGANA
ncbi:MAG: hypothetical protein GY938_27115 [Ketobacter sp.]|nr:hypothetical protein [Ketobacter sp.]